MYVHEKKPYAILWVVTKMIRLQHQEPFRNIYCGILPQGDYQINLIMFNEKQCSCCVAWERNREKISHHALNTLHIYQHLQTDQHHLTMFKHTDSQIHKFTIIPCISCFWTFLGYYFFCVILCSVGCCSFPEWSFTHGTWNIQHSTFVSCIVVSFAPCKFNFLTRLISFQFSDACNIEFWWVTMCFKFDFSHVIHDSLENIRIAYHILPLVAKQLFFL